MNGFFHSYYRLMVGHEECNVAKWVWMGNGIERIFDDEWICPVCQMYMETSGSGRIRNVNVPLGCLFLVGEEMV